MDLSNDYNPVHAIEHNSIFTNTFFRMFLGLLASALTAFYVYSSGLYVNMILNNSYLILCIVEILVVLAFSFLFTKLSPTAVTILFFAYAFLNGFTLSVVFAAYELTSITYCFAATAALFGVLAYIGYTSKADLSNWGTILMVALIIGIVLTIVNIFIGSSMLDIALDWGILFIFAGLTIYDINKITKMKEMGFCEDEKLYVYGAMQLYLDFINLFLRIISIFGKRKN